jgi:hypothetical protein
VNYSNRSKLSCPLCATKNIACGGAERAEEKILFSTRKSRKDGMGGKFLKVRIPRFPYFRAFRVENKNFARNKFFCVFCFFAYFALKNKLVVSCRKEFITKFRLFVSHI